MTPTLQPGIMMVHANKAQDLRTLVGEWTARYPLAPLEYESIIVQSNGIAQWLRLAFADPSELSEDTSNSVTGSIAAGIDLCLPSSFIWRIYRQVLGKDRVAVESALDKKRLVWRLIKMLPNLINDPVFEPLKRFLVEDTDIRKRYQLAQKLADLYDQYQVYRADWLINWQQSNDVITNSKGQAKSIADEQKWQCALWRAILNDVSEQDLSSGQAQTLDRAQVHAEFMKVMGESARSSDHSALAPQLGLPRRVIVFGISSLSRQTLEVLACIAHWSQVLICVQNPCQYDWSQITLDKDILRAKDKRHKLKDGMPAEVDEESLHLYAHPLLAAWGKQGRDFMCLLSEHDQEVERNKYSPLFERISQKIDIFESHATEGTASYYRVLNQLQDDILELRTFEESKKKWGAIELTSKDKTSEKDNSIQFHIAHSAQREVEILHDQLLAAFNNDATLRPRDIIVMVPDLNTYTPHIRSVFGMIRPKDKRYIPFSLADQGKDQNNPVVRALETILGIPQSRVGVTQVLDLIEVPAVRNRFQIKEEDLPLLKKWINGSQIKWGLNASHKKEILGIVDGTRIEENSLFPREQSILAQNSWVFGIKRMLLGYASGHANNPIHWRGVEPYSEVGGMNSNLIGSLLSLITQLENYYKSLNQQANPSQWSTILNQLLNDFFLTEETNESYTLLQLRKNLQTWLEYCEDVGLCEDLSLAIVSDHWLSTIDQGSLSQRFFAGAVTFATLMPMRAIPFRHVWLLGMNEGDFPRTLASTDFDLMNHNYRAGDRSRRDDDRYLFLDALLSAKERLSISWVGKSIRDNTDIPPSVLVSQLMDHIDSAWPSKNDMKRKTHDLCVYHHLQGFNSEYFKTSQPNSKTKYFTYSNEWLANPTSDDSNHASEPGAVELEKKLSLEELAHFLRDPVKTYFNKRLGVFFDLGEIQNEDLEPFSENALSTWIHDKEILETILPSINNVEKRLALLQSGLDRIRRRGDLPSGELGEYLVLRSAEVFQKMFEAYDQIDTKYSVHFEDDYLLDFEDADSEFSLFGRIQGQFKLNKDGQWSRIVLEPGSLHKEKNLKKHNLIKHWVMHLAAQLIESNQSASNSTHPHPQGVTSIIVSKTGSIELSPIDPQACALELTKYLKFWDSCMHEPKPLPVQTGFAYLKKPESAQKIYEGDTQSKGEVERNSYLKRCWSDFSSLCRDGEFEILSREILGLLDKSTEKEEATKR